MRGNKRYLLIPVLAGMIVTSAWAEELTITSYYPAPYGVYKELTTTADTYLAVDSGYVGIGTRTPSSKLDVNGNLHVSGNLNIGGSESRHQATGHSGFLVGAHPFLAWGSEGSWTASCPDGKVLVGLSQERGPAGGWTRIYLLCK